MDKKTTRKKFKIDEIIMGILLFVMATIAFVNVLGRYLFHYSLAFTEEIGVNFFVWITILGIGVAFERGSHLGMVSLFNKFPKPLKRAVVWLNLILSATLIGIINWFTILTIYKELTLFHSTSSALGVQMWVYYMGVPVFSVFVFIRMWEGHRKSLAKLKEEK
ncbi:MAG: TRAP transporter small permease subunit [Nitrospiraceae bacterium]|nr:TRAP transporter small permease subunit [Nitrospiraceae bacterium]